MMRHSSSARLAAPRRDSESGFALLVIFLIAAAVAFAMYQELPRAAFESARDKEQVLMDRGNQYKRAIQVFYAVNKRYPAEIKDLENTNEKRFLRRRYIDPMTGQDEWRLIHTNGSFLTDSLVTKPPTQNAANGLPGAGQTPGGGPLGANNMNSVAPPSTAPVVNNPTDPSSALAAATLQNSAALRRPSDRGFSGGPFSNGPGSQPQPGFNQNGAIGNPLGGNTANFDPNDPSTWPPITLVTPNAQAGQQPQQPGLGQRPGNAPFLAGQVPGGANQNLFGIPGQLPGQGGSNPQPTAVINPSPQNDNLNQPQFNPSPDGTTQPPLGPSFPQPGAPLPQPGAAFPQPSAAPQQQPGLAAAGFNPQTPTAAGAQPNPALPGNNAGNAALNAIDTALFRPNQAATTAPTGSPGIAGVASKFEGPSIKAYRERTKYQEWEFVYEPNTNQAAPAGAPGQAAQPNPLTPNPAATGTGQTPGQAGGATNSNPFSMPNPFAPVSPAQPGSPQ